MGTDRSARKVCKKGDETRMIAYLMNLTEYNLLFFICVLLKTCTGILPRDQGRAFAVEGQLSQGKPRGAGFWFVIVFLAAALLFGAVTREVVIYLILVAAAMMTGFLDDCSEKPWGELKKGLFDLAIAVMTAVTFLNFNPNTIHFALLGTDITLPVWLYGILIVVLVWAAINVTNCSDGVDGLSGTLGIVTLMTIYMVSQKLGGANEDMYLVLLFCACILGYLWFNATPSKLLMGDAGSRAMGVFIAIMTLKSGCPVLYLLTGFVFIMDGGLGLVKVALLRYLKIRILANTKTPLHDHVRKVWGWSNTQTVYRFVIVQIVIAVAVVYLAR